MWWLFFIALWIVFFGGVLLLLAFWLVWKITVGLILGALALRTFTPRSRRRGTLLR